MKIRKKSPPHKKKILLIALCCVGIISGLYILLLTQSPRLSFIQQFESQKNQIDAEGQNIIVISKIGVSIPFYIGDQSVLQNGAWHRYPERGDPENGGNFILSAHRFNLGFTPQRTKARSPFYNIHKLETGDIIDIRFNNNQYKYAVTKSYDVSRTAVKIEAPSLESKLTLYSCALGGEKDGRIVVEAKHLDDFPVVTHDVADFAVN